MFVSVYEVCGVSVFEVKDSNECPCFGKSSHSGMLKQNKGHLHLVFPSSPPFQSFGGCGKSRLPKKAARPPGWTAGEPLAKLSRRRHRRFKQLLQSTRLSSKRI